VECGRKRAWVRAWSVQEVGRRRRERRRGEGRRDLGRGRSRSGAGQVPDRGRRRRRRQAGGRAPARQAAAAVHHDRVAVVGEDSRRRKLADQRIVSHSRAGLSLSLSLSLSTTRPCLASLRRSRQFNGNYGQLNQLGQLSLAPLPVPAFVLRGKGGNATSAGWQVTPFYPTSSGNGDIRIYLSTFTFYQFKLPYKIQLDGRVKSRRHLIGDSLRESENIQNNYPCRVYTDA